MCIPMTDVLVGINEHNYKAPADLAQKKILYMLITRFGFLRETFLGTITDPLMKMSALSQSCSEFWLLKLIPARDPVVFMGLLLSQKAYGPHSNSKRSKFMLCTNGG